MKRILPFLILLGIVLAIGFWVTYDLMLGGVPKIANAQDAYIFMPQATMYTDKNGIVLDVRGKQQRTLIHKEHLTPDVKHALLMPSHCIGLLDGKDSKCAHLLASKAANYLDLAYVGIERDSFKWNLWQDRLSNQLARLPVQDLIDVYAHAQPYGKNVFGIAEASRVYFNCDYKDLDISQAAILASIAGNSVFNPFDKQNLSAIEKDTRAIISALVEQKLADSDLLTADNVFTEKLVHVAGQIKLETKYIVDKAQQMMSAGDALQGHVDNGPVVKTTIDYELQKKASRFLQANIAKQRISDGAIMIIDTRNREYVLAADANTEGLLPGALLTKKFQPGSMVKPLAFVKAIMDKYTAASMIADKVSKENQLFYKLGGEFKTRKRGKKEIRQAKTYGSLPLRQTLHSQTVGAWISLVDELGAENLYEFYNKLAMGYTKKDGASYFMSVALGEEPTSLEALMSSYSVLAQNGNFHQPSAFTSITVNGKMLAVGKHKANRLIDSADAYIVTHMLKDVFIKAAADDPENERVYRYFHGKAGLSYKKDRVYVIGYNGHYVIGLSFKPGSALKVTSGYEAGMPLWAAYVSLLPEKMRQHSVEKAFGVNCVGIDPMTAGRTDEDDPKYVSCFKLGTEPQHDAPARRKRIPAFLMN